jgi:hypothetical protein
VTPEQAAAAGAAAVADWPPLTPEAAARVASLLALVPAPARADGERSS